MACESHGMLGATTAKTLPVGKPASRNTPLRREVASRSLRKAALRKKGGASIHHSALLPAGQVSTTWALVFKLTPLMHMSTPDATVGFSKEPRKSSFSSRGHFSVQKHREGYHVPLLPTSTCSSVLSPELFWPKRKSISMRSMQRTKA